MSIKVTVFALPLLVLPHICLAQVVEKNGLPCVSEICLGDGINELSKVQWDRAKSIFGSPQKPDYIADRKIPKGYDMERVQSRFRGDLARAAPFLQNDQFDSGALPFLSRVTAACEKNELIGTYTTQGGNPTRVGIALTPSQSDTSKQQWTVITIMRTFPNAISNEQKAEIESELTKRYYAFGAKNMNIKNAKPGQGRFFSNYGSPFGFHLSLFRGIEEGNRMKLHPACGGAAKVKID